MGEAIRIWFCFKHLIEADQSFNYCDVEGEWGSGNPDNCDLGWARIERDN